MVSKQTSIINATGLHARPASVFVTEAKKYQSNVTIKNVDKDSAPVNAKSIMMILAAGLDGIENRMELHPPVNKNLFIPSEAVGLGLETLPTSLEEAVEVAKNSEFLHKFLPEELAKRYYAESLKRCAALKNAADPAEYERIHYFNAI